MIFFIDVMTPFISSTHIACDAICVHVIQYFLHSLRKKLFFSIAIFFYNEFFMYTMIFIRKNQDGFVTFKSNLNIKNLNVYFNEKNDLILYNISNKQLYLY